MNGDPVPTGERPEPLSTDDLTPAAEAVSLPSHPGFAWRPRVPYDRPVTEAQLQTVRRKERHAMGFGWAELAIATVAAVLVWHLAFQATGSLRYLFLGVGALFLPFGYRGLALSSAAHRRWAALVPYVLDESHANLWQRWQAEPAAQSYVAAAQATPVGLLLADADAIQALARPADYVEPDVEAPTPSVNG